MFYKQNEELFQGKSRPGRKTLQSIESDFFFGWEEKDPPLSYWGELLEVYMHDKPLMLL